MLCRSRFVVCSLGRRLDLRLDKFSVSLHVRLPSFDGFFASATALHEMRHDLLGELRANTWRRGDFLA